MDPAVAEPRPRVWVSQPLYPDIEARLDAWFDVTRTPAVTDHAPEAIAAALAAADGALVTLNDRIGEAEIAGAPRLRAVANVGVGYNNLDVAALAARGIVATNRPGDRPARARLRHARAVPQPQPPARRRGA